MSKNRDYLDELNEPVRRATEKVRADQPPAGAEGRAVERARRSVRSKAAERPRFRRDLLAVAGMAATILIGIAVWNSLKDGKPTSVAKGSMDSNRAEFPPPNNWASPPRVRRAIHDEVQDKKKKVDRGAEAEIDLTTTDIGKDKAETLTGRASDNDRWNPFGGNTTKESPKPSQPTSTSGTSSASPNRPKLEPGVSNLEARTEEKAPTGGPDANAKTPPVPAVAKSDATPNVVVIRGPERPDPQVQPVFENKDAPHGPRPVSGDDKKPADVKGDSRGQQPTSPQRDSYGGNAQAKAKALDEAIVRLRVLQEQELKSRASSNPDEMRAAMAEVEKLAKDLPPKKREEVQNYLRDLASVKPEAKKPDAPAVWHRDRQQPTMARVYVGDGNSLELVSMNVTTTIEGPRARTVVDHIFRNPHGKQLEGTFEYPLPTGASPSYFAMFIGQTRSTVPTRFQRGGAVSDTQAFARLTPNELVKQVNAADWGDLREARVVNNEKALETFEEIVRGKIDPALLEYAGGNTFRGRVFPIPPTGYNRVILAYEETLPITSGQMVYRFPLPGVKLTEMKFTLQAAAAECKNPTILPKGAKQDALGSAMIFTHAWEQEKPEGEIIFRATPVEPRVQSVSGRLGDNGPRYLYTRLRPDLKSIAKDEPFARHAVFALDTSLSEHPDRFNVSMMLLKRILEDDPDITSFNILAFNVGAAWVEPKGWLPNTKEGRARALDRLNGIVLEGATDFSCVLDKLANPGFDVAAGTPVNCFVLSDGNITWGESDVNTLVTKFEGRSPMSCRFQCYRTGLGAENLELYEALTRNGGGIFNCYGEADLKAAAQAHRNHCLHVERVRLVGGPSHSDLLVAGRRAAIYPDGELILAARVNGTGRVTAMVEGTFQGKKFAEEFPIDVGSTSELAPRAWGEVAVASLLALNDPKLDTLVTAYCQQFNIVGKTASFLVLENEADYKRFNLEEERGKTLVTDVGEFLDNAWTAIGKPVSAKEAFVRFLDRIENRVNVRKDPAVTRLLGLLKDKDFELNGAAIAGGIVTQKSVPAAYLQGRERDRREVTTYLTESRRRADKGDNAGAVRVLSSVIEEHTGRSDAYRLVGYRLLDLNQPQQAARLFDRVQKQRPFEPHSYRDLARSLEESGLYAAAAINYEIVLAGTWHNRFQQDLKVVVLEEYIRMMNEAIRKKGVSKEVADVFGERLEGLGGKQKPADLRVTISWNTDATDVDLWVIEPDGTKCFYQHKATKNGGELSADMTQGYGPERYQIVNAPKGTFQVIVHYYSTNPNLLGGETNVKVSVTRNAGRDNEQTENHTVILKNRNEQVEVCKVKF